MKKIIAAFDGLKFSESTLSYALFLAKQTNSHLVGVFLEDQFFSGPKIHYTIPNKKGTNKRINSSLQSEELNLKKSMHRFELACQNEKLNFSMHHDQHVPILDLQKESIYADFLIIDRNETLTNYSESQPTRFINTLLSDIHCPVLLVPSTFTPIIYTELLYNGEPTSVNAIKLFSYLFPSFESKNTHLISVNPYSGNLHLQEGVLLKELIKRHFPDTAFTVLKGLAEIELIKYLIKKPDNTLVVMGSLKRGALSRLLWVSMVDFVLKDLNLPVFIVYSE